MLSIALILMLVHTGYHGSIIQSALHPNSMSNIISVQQLLGISSEISSLHGKQIDYSME